MAAEKHVFTWKCDSERQHQDWTLAIDTQLSRHLETQADEHRLLLEANARALMAQEAFERELATLEASKRDRIIQAGGGLGGPDKDGNPPSDDDEGADQKARLFKLRSKKSPRSSPLSSPQNSPRSSASARSSKLGRLKKRMTQQFGANDELRESSPRDVVVPNSAEALASAIKVLEDEQRYATSVLDVLIKEYWIPLFQKGVMEQADLPEMFGNLDQISALHVKILSTIDERKEASSQKSAAAADTADGTEQTTIKLNTMLAGVSALVERLLSSRDSEDGMLSLYKAYRDNVAAALEFHDEQAIVSDAFAEFIEEDTAKGRRRLRRLLMAPAARFCEYAGLFARLRPHIPIAHPLGLMMDHAIPLVEEAAREETDVLASLPPARDTVRSTSNSSTSKLEHVTIELAAAEKTVAGLKKMLQHLPKSHESREKTEREIQSISAKIKRFEEQKAKLSATVSPTDSPVGTPLISPKSNRSTDAPATADEPAGEEPVGEVNEPTGVPTVESKVKRKKRHMRVRALETAEAGRASDLAFETGDEFVVISHASPNIWKGVHNGKVGRFLSRVVEVIDEGYDGPEDPDTDDEAPRKEEPAQATQEPAETPVGETQVSGDMKEDAKDEGGDSGEGKSGRKKKRKPKAGRVLSPRASVSLILQDNDNTYVAKWAFEPQHEKVELALEVGDVIRVTQKKPEWWKGVNEKGIKGWFPEARVEKASPEQTKHFDDIMHTIRLQRKNSIVRAEDKATSPRQAVDSKEDLKQDVKQEAVASKTVGGAKADAMSSKAAVSEAATSGPSTTKLSEGPSPTTPSPKEPSPIKIVPEESESESSEDFPQAAVIYEYKARSDTELSCSAGDIVLIVSQDNPDWWEAEKDGEVGYLPRTFVKLLDKEPSKGREPKVREQDGGDDDVVEDDEEAMQPPSRSAPPPPMVDDDAEDTATPAQAAIKAVESLAGEPDPSWSLDEFRRQHALLAAAALRVCRELRFATEEEKSS